MKSMRSMMVALVAVGALLGGSAFGDDYAMLINVNYEHFDEVMVGSAGTGASGDVWNSIPNAGTGWYQNLLDSNGNTTTIGGRKTSGGTGACSTPPSPNNLFLGYTRGDTPYGEDWDQHLQLWGLDPRRTYDLYLYSGYNWATNTTAFKMGLDVKQPANANETVDSFIENENYVVYRGLSPDANGEIWVEYKNTDTAFNGFQLGVIPDGYAKIVNVNFKRHEEVMSGAAGTGASGDMWNSIPASATGFYTNLVDRIGYATRIGMRKNSFGQGACKFPDDATSLFLGYNNANDNPSNVVWHALDLWGLDTEKTYDLYLYSGYDWGTNSEPFRVGGVEKQPDQDNTEVDSYMENKNYIVFTNISPDANGDLLVEYKNYDAPFNGFQICTFDPDVLEIVDIVPVAGQDLLKITVDAPPPASNYHPESSMDLVAGGWTNVPHSDAVGNPFYTTNLGYSSGSNLTVEIYVQGTNSAEFFKIVGE